MKTKTNLDDLRKTAREIRGAALPKSITPEMVGGSIEGVVDALGETLDYINEHEEDWKPSGKCAQETGHSTDIPMSQKAVTLAMISSERTHNLFNPADIEYNKYVSNSGYIAAEDGWAISPHIPVVAGQSYYISAATFGRNSGFVWLDSEGKIISADGSASIYNCNHTAPEGASFLVFNVKSNKTNIATDVCVCVEADKDKPYAPYRRLPSLDYVRGLSEINESILSELKRQARFISQHEANIIHNNSKISEFGSAVKIYSTNLIDPDASGVKLDHYQNSKSPTAFIRYDLTDYLSVKPGAQYVIALKNISSNTGANAIKTFRFVSFFGKDKDYISSIENVDEITVPDNVWYVRCSVQVKTTGDKSAPKDRTLADVALIEKNSNKMPDFVPYRPVMQPVDTDYPRSADDYALIKDIKVGTPEANKEVTVANSDRIVIIGDSYTESHYSVKGKSYISKLSLFSDYNFENFGESGDIYIGRLDRIRNNKSVYGNMTFKQLKPKFAMLCCYTNDTKYLSIDQYITTLENTIKTLISLGCEPIVCTEYHTNGSWDSDTSARTAMLNLAKRYGLMFWDIAEMCDYLCARKRYNPFWGGSHPGTRSNAIESDNYEKYLIGLESPCKSLKIFRKRGGVDASSLDNLMFHNNEERAERFAEIQIGHSALNDAANVDIVNGAKPNSRVNSEYQSLMGNEGVLFNGIALASGIIPVVSPTTIGLNLKGIDRNDIKVYVKNTLKGPFVKNVKYSRFDYLECAELPSEGSVYKDSNGTEYTVKAAFVGGGDGEAKGRIYCLPDSSSTEAGTLTKVSGDGDATITFDYRCSSYLDSDVSNDTCGHYEELNRDDSGIYYLTEEQLASCVEIDKIHFLVVADGDFTLTDLSLVYAGGYPKSYRRTCIDYIKTNELNDNEEILSSPTFEQVSDWTNAIVTPTYETTDIYPMHLSKKVDVSTDNFISQLIPGGKLKSGLYTLEIWCRYFPEVFTDGTGEQITEDSYDYKNIVARIGNTEKYICSLKERVNTHWKMVQFPIWIDRCHNAHKDIELQIGSDNGTIEVCKVSLKRG